MLVDEVDLGGGYGIAYLPGEVAARPATGSRRTSPRRCRRPRADLGTPLPRFSIEPGRAIVGPAGLTLYTVGTVKPVRIDDGTRPHVRVGRRRHERQHPPRPVRRELPRGGRRAAVERRRRCSPASSASTARAATSSCTSAAARRRPRAGTCSPSPATGAYGRSMASNYNHVPRPPVVAVARRRVPRPGPPRDRGRPPGARPRLTARPPRRTACVHGTGARTHPYPGGAPARSDWRPSRALARARPPAPARRRPRLRRRRHGGGAAAHDAGRRTSPRAWVRRWSSSASPCATSRPSATPWSTGRCSPPTRSRSSSARTSSSRSWAASSRRGACCCGPSRPVRPS